MGAQVTNIRTLNVGLWGLTILNYKMQNAPLRIPPPPLISISKFQLVSNSVIMTSLCLLSKVILIIFLLFSGEVETKLDRDLEYSTIR